MLTELTPEEVAAVTMLLQAGKTIRDITKFADLDGDAVTRVARKLDLEPGTPAQRRGKELYASPNGYTFQAVAKMLAAEGFRGDDDAAMHHLTVASWVRNFGWPWGGAEDGDYAPDRAATPAARSRFVLRLSKTLDGEINAADKIAEAARHAWAQLSRDETRIVQLAIIRGAAATGATNLAEIKKTLFDLHGDDIRSAKDDPNMTNVPAEPEATDTF